MDLPKEEGKSDGVILPDVVPGQYPVLCIPCCPCFMCSPFNRCSLFLICFALLSPDFCQDHGVPLFLVCSAPQKCFCRSNPLTSKSSEFSACLTVSAADLFLLVRVTMLLRSSHLWSLLG
ncbi:hypothetical protein DPMN_010941 [Dreissena polymorpha]|uniref:Uncharacterized protein n=1 Tax=Dreissena polymorpha TaxID=45954 RepID=A0A9D4N2Y5_DREPO|nr:hypothetical protein DPMN_010941 [Dreissena polymorpha]